jgi:hypothetical protein
MVHRLKQKNTNKFRKSLLRTIALLVGTRPFPVISDLGLSHRYSLTTLVLKIGSGYRKIVM